MISVTLKENERDIHFLFDIANNKIHSEDCFDEDVKTELEKILKEFLGHLERWAKGKKLSLEIDSSNFKISIKELR